MEFQNITTNDAMPV